MQSSCKLASRSSQAEFESRSFSGWMVRGVPGDMVKGQGSGPQRGTYLVDSNSGYIAIYLDVSGFQPRGCPCGVHWLKSAQSLAGESG